MGRVVFGWLVLIVACGRVGFEPSRRDVSDDAGSADASRADAGPTDAGADGLVDSARACEYLPGCMVGEITCCTDVSIRCILETSPCDGTTVRCSLSDHAGCPPRWACCSTPQRPEPTCYDELVGAPC